MANTRQANEPGYNNRSLGGGLLRGGLLLLVAVVVGAVLLQQTKEGPKLSGTPAAVATTTTVAPDTGLEVTPTPDPADPLAIPAATALPLRAQALVKVLVVNGSGVNRAAARVRASMATTGYNLLQATDATASNLADSVFYNPGFEGEARQIATLLGEIDTVNNILPITSPLPIKPPIATSDVVVIVGPKLQVKYQSQQLGTGTVAGTPVAAAAGASTVRTGTKKKATVKTTVAATGRARGTKKTTTTKAPAAAAAADPTPAALDPTPSPAADPTTAARVPVGSPSN
jgi:LytR cell envelope-related transcriptional attenuator